MKLGQRIIISFLVIVVLVAICLQLVLKKQKDILKIYVTNEVEYLNEVFNQLLFEETKSLSVGLEIFAQDEAVKNVYLEKDREKLYTYIKPLFYKLRDKYRITHFYFILPDGHCFLRVHKEDFHSDLITRHTFEEAKDNKAMVSGLELGKTAFALRVVRPYYKNGALIGYIEFGKEINSFLNLLKSNTGNYFLLYGYKDKLDENKFKLVESIQGKKDDWGNLEKVVVLSDTMGVENRLFLEGILEKESKNIGKGIRLMRQIKKVKEKSFAVCAKEIIDVRNEPIGELLIFIDITKHTKTTSEIGLFIVNVVIALCLLVLAIGLLVAYSIVKPVLKLTDAVKRIGKGDLNVSFESKAKDEIGELSRSFSKMVKNLQKTTVSRDYVDSIVSSMADMLIVLAPDGKIEKINKIALGILGYNEEELIREDISLLFLEEEEIPFKGTKLEKLIKDGLLRNYEINLKAKDGQKILVLLSGAVIKDENDNIKSIVCVAKDITELERIEKDLLESGKKYKMLFDLSQDAIMTLTPPSWKFTSANLATIKLFKAKNEEEFISKGPWDLSPTYQTNGELSSVEAKRMIEKAMDEGSSFFEWDHMRLNGEIFPAVILLSRIELKDKQQLQATVRDVTESRKKEEEIKVSRDALENKTKELNRLLVESVKSREITISMLDDNNKIRDDLEVNIEKLKKTQAQLIHAEKMEAVGRMASGIAHEVKNPLGIILQGINYFENKIPLSEKDHHELLSTMKNGINRADGIIRSLLDFSRAENPDIRSRDLNLVIGSSLALVGYRIKNKGIILFRKLEKELPKILLDQGKIEQVFVNLFNNAIDAMDKGGELYICSYLTKFTKALYEYRDKEDCIFKLDERVVVVEVEDTGVGMDDSVKEKLFEPFFTTKGRTEGTGLGLSVAKSIIEMHRGLVSVESVKGKGTKFTIIFGIPTSKSA